MQQNRGYLTDCAMGSVLVAVPAPILQLFPGVFKAHEPMGIQTFRPQFAVERLDEGVVRGLSGAAEVQRDTVGEGRVWVVRAPGALVTACIW